MTTKRTIHSSEGRHESRKFGLMRRCGIVLAGLSLFAVGGPSASVSRARGPLQRSSPEQSSPEREQIMARKVKAAPPSLADDRAALDGWWARGFVSEGQISRLVRLELGPSGGGTLRVYDLDTQFQPWRALVTVELEERGEDRLITYLNYDHPETKYPAFEYHLSGDRLDLEARSTEWHGGEDIWDLSGQWHRLRLPEDAEPKSATAPTRR